MPSASSLFLLSFCFRNLLLKYSPNALEIFEDFLYAKTKSHSEGEPEERPRGQVRPLPWVRVDPWVGPAPARGTSPRGPPTPINCL